MKTTLKISVMMILFLSSFSLSASIINKDCIEQVIYDQSKDALLETGTPVYEAGTNKQVAILEKDYPLVSANFSADFPMASQQLWIRDGRSLFVYFVDNGKKVTAIFTTKGYMNYAVSNISVSDVPESILLKISNDYPIYAFLSAKKIMTGGYTSYELVFENCHEFVLICTTDDNEIAVINKMYKTSGEAKCGHKLPYDGMR